jgi:hypothetical protein
MQEWIWSSGGMILTAENWRTRSQDCPRATLSKTNPTFNALAANPGFRGEKPTTNRLSYGTALIVASKIYQIQFFSLLFSLRDLCPS